MPQTLLGRKKYEERMSDLPISFVIQQGLHFVCYSCMLMYTYFCMLFLYLRFKFNELRF